MALNIQGGIVQHPTRAVIYGPEGSGKTTFAAQAPRAIFIDLEDGSWQLPVARIMPEGDWTWHKLLVTVQEVARDSSQVGTLVIDTADAAESLCVAHCCERDGKSDIEDWGYGKGYAIVATEFRSLLSMLDRVVASGANVIVVGHSATKKFERPDEMGSFDRYELKLTKQISPMVKEWADTLLFCDFKNELVTYSKTGKTKVTGFRRLVHTQHSGAWDAKNRFGLPAEMEMDFGPLLPYFPDHGQTEAPAPQPMPVTAPVAPAPVPMPAMAPVAQPVAAQPVPVAPVTAPAIPDVPMPQVATEELPWSPGQGASTETTHAVNELYGYPPSHVELAQCMLDSGVSDEELRRYMADHAFQDVSTPVAQYGERCVAWLCKEWDGIAAEITSK
jgi:hypothetical protein